MIEILKNNELLGKLDELKSKYNSESKDHNFLDDFFSENNNVDEWIYSTGPIFDQPPYALEMAGFDTGRILKKKYSSPYEARLKGAYSSGFIRGKHYSTVFPSKPASMPLQANFFSSYDEKLTTRSIVSNKITTRPEKPPKLLGIGEIFHLRTNILAYVGVGKGDAYVIRLFYYDDQNKIARSSMVTAPNDFQHEFYFNYNEIQELISIECNGIIWERKPAS